MPIKKTPINNRQKQKVKKDNTTKNNAVLESVAWLAKVERPKDTSKNAIMKKVVTKRKIIINT